MISISTITLENEMDLIVAHKRAIKVAQFLTLTLTTQSTFATAVAEVSREVIDKTNTGILSLGLEKELEKYFLCANIFFLEPLELLAGSEGLSYAKRLVPEFNYSESEIGGNIDLKIGIPRLIKISREKIDEMKIFFATSKPDSPYEQLKEKNYELHQQTIQKEQQLLQSKLIDDKKNEFISIASHELKTPLTTIKAFTQMALREGDISCSDKVRTYLRKIDTQSSKLQTLIAQLLDISKIESGQLNFVFERVFWNSYFEEVFTSLQILIPDRKITLNMCDDVEVSIDKLRMEQVITNLVSNAAKYSGASSSIMVSCAVFNQHITVTIKDQGIGMSKENLVRVFDKFYREERTQKNYSGLGIGLYITSQILRQHNGTIWAESTEGSGSSFHFTLPVVAS